MDRKTREIETPVDKHKLIIYAYILGGEKEDIHAINEPKKLQKFIVETVIVSIDGEVNKDKFNHLVRNMHGQDYDFVNLELAKVLVDSAFDSDKKKD